MHTILSAHPRIFIPNPEIGFYNMDDFCQHPDFCFYVDGSWWAQQYAPQDCAVLRWYCSFFTPADEDQLVGENTPTYLASEKAPGRIADLLPNVKILIMLRDPASRTYSHYWHLLRTGRAIFDFEDSLRFNPETLIKRSLYKPQVERFLHAFSAEQVLVVAYEDFVANMSSVVRRVCDFLGVCYETDLVSDRTHKNRAMVPKRVQLRILRNRLLRRQEALRYSSHFMNTPPRRSRTSLTVRIVERVHNWLNPLCPDRPPPMNQETRRFLNDYFARENAGLDDIIGEDISSYWYRE